MQYVNATGCHDYEVTNLNKDRIRHLGDPSEVLAQKIGQNERENIAIRASFKPISTQMPLMPNPPNKPTGYFLMGEGGGGWTPIRGCGR